MNEEQHLLIFLEIYQRVFTALQVENCDVSLLFSRECSGEGNYNCDSYDDLN